MEPAEGAVIAGKYRLVGPLARGGMGMVWTAQHVTLGTRLAVKFVDPSFAANPAFLARFEREARAAALIESPHVVHVQDFGVETGTPYLVMELLSGEDLGMRLRRQRRLSLAETARIVSQAGHALRRAHERGIIHRDLKPANLFLARVYEQEVVKVLDFGIAKETGATVGENTTTGEVIGSPHYMGPEQARADKDIDHRSDLWSVGVLVYRMLTGTLPFPGDVMGAILAKIFVEPPPPVASVAPDLPAELDAFFAKALAKQKEHRFQTIDDLVVAFLAIAERHGGATAGARRSLPDSSLAAIATPLPVAAPGPARAPASITPAPGSGPHTPLPASAPSTPLPASAPSTPPHRALPSAPPGPITPPYGLAPVSSPSIATGVASVQDASVTPAAPPRRSLWIAAAAGLAVAAGVAGLVLARSPAPPATGAAEPPPGAEPPPAASSASPAPEPAATPTDPAASAPSTGASASTSSASSAEPVTEPPATGVAAQPSPPHTSPATGAPATKGAAPASTRKGSTRSDEWGF